MIRPTLVAMFAALSTVALSSQARAEVYPGSTDAGYRVYSLQQLDSSNKPNGNDIGMLVVVGGGSSDSDTAGGWTLATANWFWRTPDGNGDYCYSAQATPPVKGSFAAVLEYDSSAGGDDSWKISNGKVKGCSNGQSPDQAVTQRPLKNLATVDWNNSSDSYWKVVDSSTAAGSQETRGYVKNVTNKDLLRWLHTNESSCSPPPTIGDSLIADGNSDGPGYVSFLLMTSPPGQQTGCVVGEGY